MRSGMVDSSDDNIYIDSNSIDDICLYLYNGRESKEKKIYH